MVKKTDFTYDSRDKVTKIHAVKWAQQTALPVRPVAVLQIVHGMAEYSERYHDLAVFMAEH